MTSLVSMGRFPLLLLAVLSAGCDPSGRDPAWVTATSRDATVSIDLPLSYQREGVSDTWVVPAPDGVPRRVSVRFSGAGVPGEPPVPPEPWENGCGPAAEFSDIGCVIERTRTETRLAGRPLVIETGRHVEGGFSLASPFGLRATWQRGPTDTVRLEGIVPDSAGLAELREIAESLRPVP